MRKRGDQPTMRLAAWPLRAIAALLVFASCGTAMAQVPAAHHPPRRTATRLPERTGPPRPVPTLDEADSVKRAVRWELRHGEHAAAYRRQSRLWVGGILLATTGPVAFGVTGFNVYLTGPCGRSPSCRDIDARRHEALLVTFSALATGALLGGITMIAIGGHRRDLLIRRTRNEVLREARATTFVMTTPLSFQF